MTRRRGDRPPVSTRPVARTGGPTHRPGAGRVLYAWGVVMGADDSRRVPARAAPAWAFLVPALAGLATAGLSAVVGLIVVWGVLHEDALEAARRDARVRHNVDELEHRATGTNWDVIVRQTAPHAPPEVRWRLADDLKEEAVQEFLTASSQSQAEVRNLVEPGLVSRSRLLTLAALAMSVVLGAGAGVGVWFLVRPARVRPPQPPRPTRPGEDEGRLPRARARVVRHRPADG